MKYKQMGRYQKIGDGSGRSCDERWDIIKEYTSNVKYNLSIDIGSAEGFYAKKLSETDIKNVLSVEGSDEPYKEQIIYCKDEIDDGEIKMYNLALTQETIDLFLNKNYDVCLLLAVLHWCDNPDLILKKLSEVSEYTFIEIPDLDDTVAYGQEYLKRIKNDFGSTKNYIEMITDKKVIKEYRIGALTTNQRSLFIV
jgi:hypothetical protein